jgi:membrane protease YdiL (CAAX protease family)
MMDTRLNTKRILIFLAFAFGIPWTAALVLYSTVGRDDLGKAITLANLFLISAPALANVVTRLITKEGWRHLWLKPNFRRGWRFYLAVWLLPLLVMIPGALAYYLIFPQSFDPNLSTARNDQIPFPVAGIANPWLVMLSYTLQYMVIQGLLIGVVAIGEEFGWRAYLLQRLMDRFSSAGKADTAASARKAALLVGVIWGVWHLPAFLMQWETYNPFPGAFFLYMLLYVVGTCTLSVLLSWATLRSGSVWPACIGHTTIIGVSWVSIAALQGPPNLLLNPSPDGLIGNLGFIVLTLVLLFSRRAFAGEQKTCSERARTVAIANPG